MKTIILDGRIGSNGTEVKTTKTGKQYARFSLANNTFVNGEVKTEWYDVISYDPIFIEKRAQYCGKGSYVIVTGDIRTEVKVDQTNKMWINHYITAQTIDTPRFGGKNDTGETDSTPVTSTPTISTYTGKTGTDYSAQSPTPLTAVISEDATKMVNKEPETSKQIPTAKVNFGDINNDDLPF